jgi:hypothetical protein
VPGSLFASNRARLANETFADQGVEHLQLGDKTSFSNQVIGDVAPIGWL